MKEERGGDEERERIQVHPSSPSLSLPSSLPPLRRIREVRSRPSHLSADVTGGVSCRWEGGGGGGRRERKAGEGGAEEEDNKKGRAMQVKGRKLGKERRTEEETRESLWRRKIRQREEGRGR